MHLHLLHSGLRENASQIEIIFQILCNVSFHEIILWVFFYSSLFTLGIIVCICNMCKHNICLQVSSCVHYSMKQWSIWNARTFLKMLLLVNNSSCSECCISCTPSLLILKITQVTWFLLCALKNTTAFKEIILLKYFIYCIKNLDCLSLGQR